MAQVSNDLNLMTSPRIRFLSQTNVPPIESERQKAKELLIEGERESLLLDSQVAKAQIEFDRLRLRRTSLQEQLDSCHNILSPIRTFPPELIKEIFRHAIDDADQLQPSVTEAPLLLCQICSRWREIALGFAYLWSTLHMDLRIDGGPLLSDPNIFMASANRRMRLATEWLERAKSSPLSIALRVNTSMTLEKTESFPLDFLKPLIPYYEHVEHLELALPYSVIQYSFETSPIRMPLLRSFEFRFSDCYRLGSESRKTRTFLADACIDSEHLRRITFSPVTSEMCIAMSIPWQQLTHITIIGMISTPTLPRMFQSCKNLEELVLLGISQFGGAITDHAILPNLRLLDVYLSENENSIPRLFRMFTLPALVNLKIRYAHDEEDEVYPSWPQAEFEALQLRSAFRLERFTWVGISFTPETLKKLFQSISYLRHLDLTCIDLFYTNVFDILTASESNSDPMLPCLEILIINGYFHGLLTMVESRCWSDVGVTRRNGVSRLKELRFNMKVKGRPFNLDAILPRFQNCVREGLEFFPREWLT